MYTSVNRATVIQCCPRSCLNHLRLPSPLSDVHTGEVILCVCVWGGGGGGVGAGGGEGGTIFL